MVQSSDSTGAMLANDDDAQYTIDMGLVRRGPAGLEVANGIYAEVIPRALNAQMQMNFEPLQRTESYLDGSGRL
ncbi:MAG: hypothetical protein FJW39_33430, partial [Acidobacteria bacterium]|nr:hypothetical protein [Acidobacteriota bacterium]